MRLPSKIFSYDESTIVKFPTILRTLRRSPLTVRQLYETTRMHWEGIGAYMETLDCLYALGKIRFDDKEEMLFYVG